MKKLLVAVLACALFAPAFAVENVRITGDIQTIGLALDDRGTGFVGDNYKGTTNRVLFGIGADLVEDVYAKLTFAHGWANGFNDTVGTPINNDGSHDGLLESTYLAEAYVNISNVFDALEVKVGRQFYGDEKSAVMYFGPDYGYAYLNAYNSLDGATVSYKGEKLALTVAYFSLANSSSTTPLARRDEQNLGGLDLNYKFSDEIATTAYVYNVKDTDSWGFWGIKPTIEMNNLKLGVEYARNYSAGNGKGWQVKADLALPVATENATFTPRVTYLKSEHKFVAFGNYRPGLMFGTRLAINGEYAINNTASSYDWEIVNAGLCMKFADLAKWGFALDFYTANQDKDFLGNSWEAKVIYDVNQYVAFNLTGAILTNAGHSWRHSPTAAQLGMNIKF